MLTCVVKTSHCVRRRCEIFEHQICRNVVLVFDFAVIKVYHILRHYGIPCYSRLALQTHHAKKFCLEAFEDLILMNRFTLWRYSL